MKNKKMFLLIGLWGILILGACQPVSSPVRTEAVPTVSADPGLTPTHMAGAASPEKRILRVMTHDSFSMSEEASAKFEEENQVQLVFIKSGDTGQLVNKAVLTKKTPLADVLFGVDNGFLSRALNEGIFERYQSPFLTDIPADFQLDPAFGALPVDYGDVCINYDKGYFAKKNLTVPASFEDLISPAYKGLLVVENPATSSPGMAFLLATVVHFGEDGYLDYWKQLKDNGVIIVNDWETAYYTNFSGSSGKGSQPMVVSYASSPVAEVIFADPPVNDAPTASLVGDNMCFRQIEFAGILQGTQNRALAEKFIDFVLSPAFQNDIPMQMFVYPVNQKAELSADFVNYTQRPDQPAELSPQKITANREKWILDWDQLMLR